jgi:NAD(P)-dependent dehydrogenase (short-subunit alcohol dehydrogenase family)
MSRVAWITGAGKGLGRAVALSLVSRGWTVAASARSETDLTTLASESARGTGAVFPFVVDVTDEAAMMATAAAIEEKVGPLDLVILNAGTHEPVRARDFSVEPFRKLFETNVMGVVHGLAAVLPLFIGRRMGHIVVVSSVAGYRGLPTGSAYGATKAALTNMCEALKPELDRYGVRITVVNPGFIRTPLTDRNPFKMPFLMEPDDAAERLVRGLDSGGFEITFPRRFTWFLKLLRCLPYALYFPLVRNLDKE